MSALDLIQQQRQVLRELRQLAHRRAEAEAKAKAELQHGIEAAEANYNQIKAYADEQLGKIRETKQKAAVELTYQYSADIVEQFYSLSANVAEVNDSASELTTHVSNR